MKYIVLLFACLLFASCSEKLTPEEIYGNTFKVGDIVKIKSGGVSMIISYKPYYEYATCFWMDTNGKIRKKQLSVHILEKVVTKSDSLNN